MTTTSQQRRPAIARAACVAVAAGLVLGACGGTPGQVPTRYEPTIDAALTSIASACGEAVEVRATGRDRGRLATLDATAAAAARRLRAVVRADRSWTYKSEALSALAAGTASDLRECGLARAAAALAGGR